MVTVVTILAAAYQQQINTDVRLRAVKNVSTANGRHQAMVKEIINHIFSCFFNYHASQHRLSYAQGRRHRFRTAGAACPDKGPMAERPKVTYTQNPKTLRIWPIIFQEGPKFCKKCTFLPFFKWPGWQLGGATAPPAPPCDAGPAYAIYRGKMASYNQIFAILPDMKRHDPRPPVSFRPRALNRLGERTLRAAG